MADNPLLIARRRHHAVGTARLLVLFSVVLAIVTAGFFGPAPASAAPGNPAAAAAGDRRLEIPIENWNLARARELHDKLSAGGNDFSEIMATMLRE
ncbi:hypothetical protein ACFU53_02960, partial [Streptomyces sp. NPDC057474]|uniref:hypothetical protein n=1 Tax=Streptomyces sp. NPDC057474 TaxID=3346144 RepID=UPI00369262E1